MLVKLEYDTHAFQYNCNELNAAKSFWFDDWTYHSRMLKILVMFLRSVVLVDGFSGTDARQRLTAKMN